MKPRILKFFGEFEVVTIHAIVEGFKGRVDYIRRNDVIEKRESIHVKLEITRFQSLIFKNEGVMTF